MFASVQQYFLAGWGSLFRGIKGLEHLVPPPRELPTSSVAIAGSSRGAPAGARSLVSSSSSSSAAGSLPSEGGGGLRGFFRQFRDMSTAATQQAEEAARARNATKNGTVVDSVATPVQNNGNGQAASANGARRARPTRRRLPCWLSRLAAPICPNRPSSEMGKMLPLPLSIMNHCLKSRSPGPRRRVLRRPLPQVAVLEQETELALPLPLHARAAAKRVVTVGMPSAGRMEGPGRDLDPLPALRRRAIAVATIAQREADSCGEC